MKYLSLAVQLVLASACVRAHGAGPIRAVDADEKALAEPMLYDNGAFNLDAIDARVSRCDAVVELSHQVHALESDEESLIERLFAMLFPFGAAWNGLLATTYISGPPNLLLGLIPPNINPSSLSTLVSFAVGGLLGDVFLHLLPQTFVGEGHGDAGVRMVVVDEKRNIILGLGMFIGFVMFFVIDRAMRILGAGHDHDHAHAHHGPAADAVAAASSAVKEKSELKQRAGKGAAAGASKPVVEEPGSSIKLSAYLNLIADFTHNITDGLAISASFYISKSVGATTCLAVFFHEIPHEVGDFALLIQGGFSKTRAMQAQFVTAIGAYLGTIIGIAVNEWAVSFDSALDAGSSNAAPGIFGSNVRASELTLPFTAGGFLYIATVGVIPELLESGEGQTKAEQIKNGLVQLGAMFVGIGLMFGISWLE